MLENFYNNFIFKYSRVFLFIIVLGTIFLGYKAFFLKIDASSDTLILENDKDLAYHQLLSKRYKTPDFLVIAFSPKKGLFSEESIYTIKSITNELLSLEKVQSVNSILNVPLLESSKKPLADILEGIPLLKDNIVPLDDAKKEFISSPLYKDNLVSSDFKTTAILVNLRDNFELNKTRQKLKVLKTKIVDETITDTELNDYNRLSNVLTNLRDTERQKQSSLIQDTRYILKKYKANGEIYLGGIPMIANDVVNFVKNDLKVFGVSILIFLIIVLFIIFRQIRWVILPIITCMFSVAITSGLFSILNWEVTVISSNFISLQLILTMAITIHLIVRYRELVAGKQKTSQKNLLLDTVLQMIKPCFFTVITTIAGFSSLILSDLLPVINFGWMMSLGVSISLLVTFLIFPILLVELDKLYPNLNFENKFNLPEIVAKFASKYGNLSLIAAIIIIVFSIVGVTNLKVENSFIDYFKSNTEISKGMTVIDNKLGGTTILDVTLDFDHKNVDINNSEINLEPIEDDFDDLLMEFEEDSNEPKYWFTEYKMGQIEKLHDYLDSLEETGKVLSFATILKIGRVINNGNSLDSVQLGLMYEKLSEEYKEIIIDPYISTQNNQARITLRVKDSDPELRRNELIKKIKSEAPQVLDIEKDKIKLSNILVLYNNMLQSLFSSQILTLGLVIAVLFAMFVVLFKSLKISVIALLPNLLSIGSVLGLMGVFSIPLDMMTITIAAISMGIAVDNTIHYIFRHRIEYNKSKNYENAMIRTHTSIGYALYYTTLTIIVGFSILVFSNFIPSIYFGLLTSLAMFIALFATLTIVPKLLSLFKVYN
ncbi:MAG: hypothetical protein CFH34_00764 [Alphaproteobacteria bacterium MarineAlpha9_Bin4]|nr:MAG: hypothetical protein CFH34_00764 [Alphaproteobacteria bacterium MarineAlpha9_Bin4]